MFSERQMPYGPWDPLPFEDGESETVEREREILRSWYSGEILRAQEAVERACDELDYESSWIYDEYPDRGRMEQELEKIREKLSSDGDHSVEAEEKKKRKTDNLLRVLWYHELFRRRCRRKNCRRRYR